MEESGQDWVKVFGDSSILEALEPYLDLNTMKSLRSLNATICKKMGESGMFERKAKLVVNLTSEDNNGDLRVMRNAKEITLRGDFVKLDDYGGSVIDKYGKEVEMLRLESWEEPIDVNKLVRCLLVRCPMLKRLEIETSEFKVDARELLTRKEYGNDVSGGGDTDGYFGLKLKTVRLDMDIPPMILFPEACMSESKIPKAEIANSCPTTKALLVLFLVCPNVTIVEGDKATVELFGISVNRLKKKSENHCFGLHFWDDDDFECGWTYMESEFNVVTGPVRRGPITKTEFLRMIEGNGVAHWCRCRSTWEDSEEMEASDPEPDSEYDSDD